MKQFKTLRLTLLALLPCVFMSASGTELPTRSEVLAVANKVNNLWITNHFTPGNNEWPRATYFVGNLELYKAGGKQSYYDYAVKWADKNKWLVNGGPSTANADNHTCGQVYIDLFLMDEVKDSTKIEAIRDAIDYRIENNPQSSDWWWVDAMFMAMPTITRLGVIYNDSKYFDKLYAMFRNTRDTLIVNSGWSSSSAEIYAPGPIVTCPTCGNDSDGLYNREDGLWWRDWRYQPGVPPQNNKPKISPNGKQIYWSRGNGWVFAALARTLELLPEDEPHRPEYVSMFLQMAEALKNCQREDGFWNVNLGDAEHYPGPETSGTAFFTFGMAWGINHGLLDSITYYPVAAKAWNGLSTIAIEEDGNVKYAQNVGETPTNPASFTYTSVDFGVGAVLLAAAEISKLAYDDGLPEDNNDEEIDVLLDRSDWIITTSSVGPADDAVGGSDPMYIIDGDEKTAFLFVKPGVIYGGVEVDGGTKPWFAIDMKEPQDFLRIYYRHRDYNNTSSYLRATKGSFYGKNNESDEYQPILENFDIPVTDTDIRIDLSVKATYRYVKFIFEGWYESAGNTIQVSEFYLGKLETTGMNVVNPSTNLALSIYPNPVKSGKPFNVSLDTNASSATLSIYSIMGNKISEQKIYGNNTDVTINQTGLYLIEIRTETNKFVSKIIVRE